MRLTDDPDECGISSGRPLMYPGRSHPLTRRAIASVRTGRVSAARGRKRSLLMTYAVEAGSLLRTVFALLLSPDGAVTEQADFLSCANDPVPPDGLWQKKFASWAPEALVAAGVRAVQVGERIASVAAAAHQDRLAREDAVVRAWLMRRANELCGPVQARTGDLFSTGPSETDWRSCEIPEQRMAGFAADPTVPIARRREAADASGAINSATAAVPASGGADFGYADAGAVTLDLDDCVLVGPAMTETVSAGRSRSGGERVEWRRSRMGWFARIAADRWSAARSSTCHDEAGIGLWIRPPVASELRIYTGGTRGRRLDTSGRQWRAAARLVDPQRR